MAERSVKYMGTADIRVLDKGDTFDGQLRDGLPTTLTFDKSNHWVVDIGDLPKEAQDLILEHDGFKDVTDLKRIPPNDHERMFLGRKSAETAPEEPVLPEGTGTSDVTGAGTDTTVGGSTEGDPGGRRGRGTTTGGSTAGG